MQVRVTGVVHSVGDGEQWMRTLWRLRVTVDDPRGRLSALAMTLSRAGASILSVSVSPAAEGRAVDQLLVALEPGCGPDVLIRAAHEAGAVEASVRPCEVRAFVDEPTRALRLALDVVVSPERLGPALAELLRAEVIAAEGRQDGDTVILLPDTVVGALALTREGAAFSAEERARALGLAECAAAAYAAVRSAGIRAAG